MEWNWKRIVLMEIAFLQALGAGIFIGYLIWGRS